ncbi:LOW QUALITY PROTEIN: hypothetical protein QYF61_012188 [Mycteria americana]|uniref:Uncharacterized protein n=1 Tax=Mycteria americana TaxID=33587 RepID=A0AAN7NKP3_MYCAM|nr:LOW QUALITY PROTEIN: hypothetical protein QYF61_012188 [Mycteria americana]
MSLSTSSKRPLNTSRDGDSTTSLGSLFQCLITLSVKKNFLISSLNLPWRNLRPFPLVLSLVTWEKRPTPPLYTLLSVEESDEVSPQPPFLQAKQSQLPQPLLIRLLLQTLPQLRCPSLDTLQYLNIPLVVGGPKLNTVFEVWPHQCRVQGHNHFPSPAGHAILDTSQDAIGFLGHLGTLLAHIQVAVNQHPQVLFHQAAFQPLFPKPVALHGVAVAQVQDLALGLVKPHTIDLGNDSSSLECHPNAVFLLNSTAVSELPGVARQGWPAEPGRPQCHSLSCYREGPSFMKLVQPKATWARSLRVKVKVEMNAFEDVLQMTKRGEWAEITAFLFIAVNVRFCLKK